MIKNFKILIILLLLIYSFNLRAQNVINWVSWDQMIELRNKDSIKKKVFIDFYTNTDIDNMYIVTSIEHRIADRAFTTSVTLSLWDSSNKHTVPGDIDGINRLINTEKNKT